MVNAFEVPRYVLRDGLLPTGPLLLHDPSLAGESLAVYGFSDKPVYDRFIMQSARLLTPYPLVKGFLRNQIESASHDLKLVVLDAESPLQTMLFAATMQSILDSLNDELTTVTPTHELTLDPSTSSFRAAPIVAILN